MGWVLRIGVSEGFFDLGGGGGGMWDMKVVLAGILGSLVSVRGLTELGKREGERFAFWAFSVWRWIGGLYRLGLGLRFVLQGDLG